MALCRARCLSAPRPLGMRDNQRTPRHRSLASTSSSPIGCAPMATKNTVRRKRPLPSLFAGRICPLSALAVVMSPWSGCAATPVGRRAHTRSPRCMRFGRACPRGSPAPFARARARLWGALRGPQNPQRWPWSPRSHASHFARFAFPIVNSCSAASPPQARQWRAGQNGERKAPMSKHERQIGGKYCSYVSF